MPTPSPLPANTHKMSTPSNATTEYIECVLLAAPALLRFPLSQGACVCLKLKCVTLNRLPTSSASNRESPDNSIKRALIVKPSPTYRPATHHCPPQPASSPQLSYPIAHKELLSSQAPQLHWRLFAAVPRQCHTWISLAPTSRLLFLCTLVTPAYITCVKHCCLVNNK